MKRTVIHPEAANELAAAMGFYEYRHPGLGGALLDAFERAVTHIQEHPLIGAPYEGGGVRRYVRSPEAEEDQG